MTVTELPKTETPIEDVDPIRQLGEAIRRGRTAREMVADDFAEKMGLSPVFVVEVERGTAVFDAKQCHEAATILRVDPDVLLSGASAWHKASWEAASKKPGFQLVEQASEMAGIRGTDPELEKIATEVLFQGVKVANDMLREGHHLIQACNRLQAVLIARGVLLPNIPDQPMPPSDGDNPQSVDEMGTEETE